jgi:hypothetical protein
MIGMKSQKLISMSSQHESSGNPKSFIRWTIISLLVFLYGDLIASIVTVQDAKMVAQNAWKKQNLLTRNPCRGEIIFSEPLSIKDGGRTAFYVFNVNDDKGFVIVAADDRIPPVLGYSFKGAYDPSDLAPGFRWFLNDKLRQVHEILSKEDVPSPLVRKEWSLFLFEALPLRMVERSMDPLISTTWDQGCYYNDSCPSSISSKYCYHSPTGCGATAMAQVIRYWAHPPYGLGYENDIHSGDTLHVDFSSARYNYDSMYRHPTSENPEIARLMYHCGVSVHMNYGDYSSGCDLWSLLYAFADHFCYSPDPRWKFRKDADSAQWESMLRAELDLGHPLIYYGSEGSSSHLFICDGYQGPAYFHFNWGWGGLDDGYFYLNDLSPEFGYNFTFDQGAIFNLVPGTLPSPGWDTVGKPGFTGIHSSMSDIRISSTGQPYIAHRSLHADSIYLQKFNGSEWENTGTPVRSPDLRLQLVLDRHNNPYLLCSDTSYAPVVSRFDGNAWSLLGGSPVTAYGQQMDITLDARDIPYVSLATYSEGRIIGFVYRFVDGAWEKLGNAPFSSDTACVEWTKIAVDSLGVVYVLWTDCANSNYARVSKFDGSTWSLLGNGTILSLSSNDNKCIAIADKSKVYVSLSVGLHVKVFRYDPAGWTLIGGGEDGFPGDYPDLAADNSGNLMLGFTDLNAGNLGSVMRYHGGEWTYEGPGGFTPGITTDCSVEFCADGNIFFAYKDVSRDTRITVQHYRDISMGAPEIRIGPENLTVYPNPCHGGKIILHGNQIQPGDYCLVDPLGRNVFSGKLEKRNHSDDFILQLPYNLSGIYFLRVSSKDSIHGIKVILY